MERIETTILRNLVFNEEYSRKVIPFIQPDYFEQRTEKIIFEEITQFIVKYGNAITTEALAIELENRTDLSETEVKESREITSSLTDAPADNKWLEDNNVGDYINLSDPQYTPGRHILGECISHDINDPNDFIEQIINSTPKILATVLTDDENKTIL